MVDSYKSIYKKVTHCIFDLDGTLLDTETIFNAATQQVLASYDRSLSNDMRLECMTMESDHIFEYIKNELQLPITTKELQTAIVDIVVEHVSDAPLMPGVERLLRHLHSHGIPMAIATGCSETFAELKIKNHTELFKLFHHTITGTCVKRTKPAPDVYIIAAEHFPDKPPPESCLAFEDTPIGMISALTAGMQVVMVPQSFVPFEMIVGATQRLSTLINFQPQDFGLPAF